MLLKPFPYNRFYFSLGLLYLLFILIISLMPINEVSLPSFIGADKVEHFIAYLVASGYFLQILQTRHATRLALFLISYGLLIEFLQSLTSYRFFDVWDILANSLGILAGVLIGRKFKLPL